MEKGNYHKNEINKCHVEIFNQQNKLKSFKEHRWRKKFEVYVKNKYQYIGSYIYLVFIVIYKTELNILVKSGNYITMHFLKRVNNMLCEKRKILRCIKQI